MAMAWEDTFPLQIFQVLLRHMAMATSSLPFPLFSTPADGDLSEVQ
jgi:hypothetical protein